MMSPIPTLNKAYNLLVDQESQRNLVNSSSFKSSLMDDVAMYSQKHPHFSNVASSSKSTHTSSYTGSGSSGNHNGGAEHLEETTKLVRIFYNVNTVGVEVTLRISAIRLWDILQTLNLRGSFNSKDPMQIKLNSHKIQDGIIS